MTRPARITQADMERATKAAAAEVARSGQPARIIFRLAAREIEVILGESAAPAPATPDAEEWTDDD